MLGPERKEFVTLLREIKSNTPSAHMDTRSVSPACNAPLTFRYMDARSSTAMRYCGITRTNRDSRPSIPSSIPWEDTGSNLQGTYRVKHFTLLQSPRPIALPRLASELRICRSRFGLPISSFGLQPLCCSFIRGVSLGRIVAGVWGEGKGKDAAGRRVGAWKRRSVEAFKRWGDAAQPRWGLF